MSAHEQLADALAAALSHGLRIPCAGSDAWVSDDPAERAQAAAQCDGCPCALECAAAGEATNERFGVWSGRDRTPRTRKEAS